MKIIKDDLWEFYKKGWCIAIPTNGWVNQTGENPMPRGVSFHANQLFKNLDKAIGTSIKKNGNHVFYFERQRLITFPTKENWRDNSSLDLINQSCLELKVFLQKFSNLKVVLPKVGCGAGKLKWETVYPILNRILEEFGEERVIVVDNEQGDTKECMGKNENNVRDDKKPLKINFIDSEPISDEKGK